MSAISEDAIATRPAQPLHFDAPEPDVAEPTEDIADEVTSELGGAPQPVRAQAQPPAPPASADPAFAPAPGSLLRERYVLEAQIGGGGMAMVFRALDRRRDGATAGGARVAIKLLRPERRDDARSIARLQREFRQTQAAAHPGVVRVFDLDFDRGYWFIVMELLNGESLAASLRRCAPSGLPRRQALALAYGIADALAHAHARGVVHGDVKPANIHVDAAGSPRLLDFGVAPDAGDAPGLVTATRAYASPEVQAGAAAEARDDVFSFACVACEALTGKHPFGRGGRKADRDSAALQRPASLDRAMWQALAPALSAERAARPGMAQLVRALRAAAEPAPPPAIAPSAATRPAVPAAAAPMAASAPARAPRVLVGAIAASALALVIGILIGRLDDGERPAPDAVPASPIEVAESAPEPDEGAGGEAGDAQAGAATEAGSSAPAPSLPPTTGHVSFDAPAMSVSNRAVVAAIPLRHVTIDGGARAARVNWRIIEGSARPGQDFGGPESGAESFAAGHTFRILYVPLLATDETTRDRTFVVELTGASPGVQIGKTPRVAVTILGDS